MMDFSFDFSSPELKQQIAEFLRNGNFGGTPAAPPPYNPYLNGGGTNQSWRNQGAGAPGGNPYQNQAWRSQGAAPAAGGSSYNPYPGGGGASQSWRPSTPPPVQAAPAPAPVAAPIAKKPVRKERSGR